MYNVEQVNKSNDKEYYLKKLSELSKPEPENLDFKVDGSVWRNGKVLLEEPTDEQKEWVLFRLSHSNTWPNIRENKIGDFKNWI